MISRFFGFIFTTGLAVLVMVWGIGFASYIGTVASYTQPEVDVNMMTTNAIVVLTGGSERLQAGVNLLLASKGEKLLVSGVHPNVSDASVIKNMLPEKMKKCCVVLGRKATDTFSNAIEATAFVQENKYKAITLVTSHYHMPRSLLVFEKHMPDLNIVPYPVAPSSVNLTEWWAHSGTLMLLIQEYTKYALVWLSSKIESYSNV